MELQTITNTILIGLGVFLFVRLVLITFLAKKLQQKILTDYYSDILHSPKYQVKGKYE